MLDALLEAIYAAWRKDTELRRDGLTGEAEGSRRDRRWITAGVVILTVALLLWMALRDG